MKQLQKCIDILNAGYAAFMPMASRIAECQPDTSYDYPRANYHLVIGTFNDTPVSTVVEETLEPLFAAFCRDVQGRFENKLSSLDLRFMIDHKKNLRVNLEGSHGKFWPMDRETGKLHIEQSIVNGGTMVYRVERLDDANVHRAEVARIGWQKRSTDYESVISTLSGLGLVREDAITHSKGKSVAKSIIVDDGYKVRKLIGKLGEIG